ncbi:tetratricopeptide repeat protein [Nonomuraea rosea]
MSRTLVGESAGKHTDLLARALRTTAGILLERGKATEALPMAQEAVALTRAIGGGPLVVSLHCLAGAFEALHRYSEAAEMLAEADQIPPADC